jgi:rhodanese-related sulfurtransferase
MKKIKYIIAIAGVLTFTACHNTKDVAKDATTEVKDNAPIYKNVTANEFKSLLRTNPGTLVDVRTPDEFKGGYISGAINIDYYSANFKQQMSELDKTKPIYVYCRSGNRSGKAMLVLQDLGFKEVYNLIGGYSQWPKTQSNPNQVPVEKATK